MNSWTFDGECELKDVTDKKVFSNYWINQQFKSGPKKKQEDPKHHHEEEKIEL